MKKKDLVLILARGGSKSIARLNLRLINGKPLLYYILNTALKSKVGDVYVSTDSEEIKQLTIMYGGKVIPRPKFLTKNSTSVEDIMEHSLSYLAKQNLTYEKCLVTSPIFPLLKTTTIRRFLHHTSSNKHTIFGFVKHNNDYGKIRMGKDIEKISSLKNNIVIIKKIVSIYVSRFTRKKKFQKPFHGVELSRDESFMINDYHDLSTIEKIIQRKKILIRVDGDYSIGLGHVYNMLTILNYLRNNEILIVMNSKRDIGSYKFKEHNYNIKYFDTEPKLFKIIEKFKPDIVFNDILDTKSFYIKKLKKFNCLIINFEDLGQGSNFADLVFNPIYYSNKNHSKKFFGSKYACVRDEFRLWNVKPVAKKVKKILITFGGTDPNNVIMKILEILKDSKLFGVEFTVVLTIGNSHKEEICEMVSKMRFDGFTIKIVEKSDIMAKYIADSDFVITSNGRTVFEVASLKVPMITISANSREEKHPFPKYSGGAIPLGNISKSTPKTLMNAIKKMMRYETRKKMAKNLQKYDLLNGVQEIIRIINTKNAQI